MPRIQVRLKPRVSQVSSDDRANDAIDGPRSTVSGPALLEAVVRTMQEVYEESLATTSFTLVMLGIAGAMAMLVGLIGIYSVLSYTVSQRKREIGIRLALGAESGALRWLFVRYGLGLAAVGTAPGLAAAAVLTRLMKSVLFGISPVDPGYPAPIPSRISAAVCGSNRGIPPESPCRHCRAECSQPRPCWCLDRFPGTPRKPAPRPHVVANQLDARAERHSEIALAVLAPVSNQK